MSIDEFRLELANHFETFKGLQERNQEEGPTNEFPNFDEWWYEFKDFIDGPPHYED